MTYKKWLAAGCLSWCACFLLAASTPLTVYAEETRIGIGSITLDIQSKYSAGMSISGENFDIRLGDDACSINSAEVINECTGDEWRVYDQPQLRIELAADSGYYFDRNTKKTVKLSGDGYEVDAVKRDSEKEYMEIIVSVKPLDSHVGTPNNVRWLDSTTGTWSKGYKNHNFRVYLYRNGTRIQSFQTASQSFNFAEYMTEPGIYLFQVNGVNDYNEKNYNSSKRASEQITVTEADLQAISDIAALLKSKAASVHMDGWMEPGVRVPAENQWILDQTGWWYRHADGSFTASAWEFIKEEWYYFDSRGYMLAETVTPDGYTVGSDGAWIGQ